MNRLEKKCFIAMTGLHLLLAVILVIGPAFLSSNDQSQELPELDFVPFKLVDSIVSGGGSPAGGSPPPAPVPVTKPEPQPLPPAPAPLVKPEPARPVTPESVKPAKPEPAESLEPAKPGQRKIQVSNKVITRSALSQEAAKARATAEANAIAAERRRTLAALNRAYSNLSGNMSGSTSIELKGPGGGGVPYGNWRAAVKQRYQEAWIVPDGVTDNSATVKVSVTIGRDGEVLSTRIIQFSGNPLVDQSVKATLDRVRYVPPLPETEKDDERTVGITFDVKTKQGLG